MDIIISLLTQYPVIFIIVLIALCLGGLVNVVIILDRRFGLLGDKTPTTSDLLKVVNSIKEIAESTKEEAVLTNTNHLSSLPDAEREIYRIGAMLDKLNDTLIRIETRLNK